MRNKMLVLAGFAVIAAALSPGSHSAEASVFTSRTQAEMLNDPEGRKELAARFRLDMALNYPALDDELDMSQQEIERLFDLIAENQVDHFATRIPGADYEHDQAAIQERLQAIRAVQRKLDDAVLSLLGSTRYEQWKEHDDTRSARIQAEARGREVASAGQPLSKAQMRLLTAEMIAAEKREREDSKAATRNLEGPMDAAAQVGLQQEAFKRWVANDHRVLEAMAPHLDSRQLDALGTALEQQTARVRASIEDALAAAKVR